MTQPEDMTKDELADAYGVSKSQTKSEMLEEIAQRALVDSDDPAVQRAREYRSS